MKGWSVRPWWWRLIHGRSAGAYWRGWSDGFSEGYHGARIEMGIVKPEPGSYAEATASMRQTPRPPCRPEEPK